MSLITPMLTNGRIVPAVGGGPSVVQYAVGSRSSNPSVTTMSGLTSGNLLVLTGAVEGPGDEWTALSSNLSSQGFTKQNTTTDSNHPSVFMASRVINGSEASSYSLNSGGGMLALIEINGTFDVCGDASKTGTSTTYNISGITVTNNNSLLFAIGAVSHTYALTMPSGMTEVFNDSSGVDPGLGVAYESVNSGATGTRQISRPGTIAGMGGVMFAVY